MNKYHPGETGNIHIQLLINIMQDNNWVITAKKGNGKLPLFCGNGEQVLPIYALNHRVKIIENKHFSKTRYYPSSIKDFEWRIVIFWYDQSSLFICLITQIKIIGQIVRFSHKNIHKNITIFNLLMRLILP